MFCKMEVGPASSRAILSSLPQKPREGLIRHDGIWQELDEKAGVHAALKVLNHIPLLLGDERSAPLYGLRFWE